MAIHRDINMIKMGLIIKDWNKAERKLDIFEYRSKC